MPATPPPDGPKIEFIYPSLVFGQDIVTALSPTPFMAYTGGAAIQASGFSSYIGQIIIERDIQPWNACSNATPSTPTVAGPVCLAY